MPTQGFDILFTKLNFLKGVGPKLYGYYKNLIAPQKDEAYFKDLLFHLPYNLLNRSYNPSNLETNIGEEIILEVTIDKITSTYFGRRKGFKAVTIYNNLRINLVFYNANEQYLNSILKKGNKSFIIGKLEKYKGEYQITHPNISNNYNAAKKLQKEPIYPLTAGISNKQLIKLVQTSLPLIPEVNEWLDQQYITENNFPNFKQAITKIHNPQNYDDILLDAVERKRLAFDELLASQLAVGITREKTNKTSGKVINSTNEYVSAILNSLEFDLTNDQQKAVKDINNDLISPNKMFRLIQGDVGSGKTIVGAITLLKCLESSFQSCFMAPTEILAKQHHEWLTDLINKAGLSDKINIGLLVGSLKKKEKAEIYQACENGEINILIGTHAVFQEKINYHNLGAIVIDEQHKFGVKQRLELANKGEEVNILFMTATPIPRTLSMTLYGDMDISIIAEKPAGRKDINTKTISASRINELIERVDKEVNLGQRIYWVCPYVEPSEEDAHADNDEKIISVTERYEYLKKYFGDRVGMVHGKMPTTQKDQEIEKFKNGDLDILVATTVIEVGVNVPEATIMIIENAEKFGLSQLHQIRGRVGRGSKESSCVLVYSKKISSTGKQRLKIMKQTNDGFIIAEEDMVLRGSGELLGTKQSGLPNYKIAELPEHKELLFAARDYVKIILTKDPNLTSEKGKNLRALLRLFEYDSQIENLNA